MKSRGGIWCCLLVGLVCVLCNDIKFAGKPDWYPYIIILQSESDKTLRCPTRQAPSDGVYMKWLKNGIQVQENHKQYFRNNNRSLVLTPLSLQDSGRYACVAYDLHGNSINFTRSLTVRDNSGNVVPPTVTQSDRSPVFVKPGDSRNISCLFYQGDSNLEWNDWAWFHNNSRLNDSDKYFTHPETVVVAGKHSMRLHLRINDIKVADLGTYTCLGVNGKGNASRNITLGIDRQELPMLVIVGIASGGACFLLIIVISTTAAIKCRRRTLYEDLPFGDDPDKYDFPRGPPLHDVFISYSSRDQDWVRQELVGYLEKHGYDVYVDFKDFTPGERIADNINHGIYRSRKTLVLLSKNFLASGYCELELETANHKRFLVRKDGLIVVKYDDCLVPEKLMTKTFLDWTDPKVQPHFWDRLTKAIGEPQPKMPEEKNEEDDVILNQDEKMEDDNGVNDNDIEANREVFEGDNNNVERRENMNIAHPGIRHASLNSTTSEDRQLIDNDYIDYNYEPDINANQDRYNHNVLIYI